MKKILKLKVKSRILSSFIFKSFLILMLFSISSTSYAMGFCFHPYVGADAQFRIMSFRKGFGDKNFRNRYPQANIYVGFKFCENVGIEGGFYSSANLSKNSFFQDNETNFGQQTPATITSVGSSQINGWHVNAVGFIPICDTYNLSALAYVGITQCKIVLRDIATNIGGFPDNFTANFSQTRTFLRSGIGIQHMITNCVGIRGIFGWENTSKFSAIGTQADPNFLVKVKDSVIFSFGLFAIY